MNELKHKGNRINYPVINNLNQLNTTVQPMVDALVEHLDTVSSLLDDKKTINLWCRGTSGLMLATLIQFIIRKTSSHIVNISYVRKDGEQAHSNNYYYYGGINVFVDDFIDTGSTYTIVCKEYNNYVSNRNFDIILVAGSCNVKSCFETYTRDDTILIRKMYESELEYMETIKKK